MDSITYNKYYNQAMQGITDMLEKDNPLSEFKKGYYAASFQEYMDRYKYVMEAIEIIYQEEEEPGKWLEKLADRLVRVASQRLKDIPKKGKRMDCQLTFNMTLATYLIPSMLEQGGQLGDELTDLIVEKWNVEFKTTVGKSTHAKIEKGFHKKLCYITTAVCESQGKPDNCYELELLRNYRDTFLLSSEEGKALVKEYYNIAPTIVNRIGKCENADKLYEEIWKTYLSPCVQLIEKDEKEACQQQYMAMVEELKGRYMA